MISRFVKGKTVISAKKHIAIELIRQAKFLDFKKIRKDVELSK